MSRGPYEPSLKKFVKCLENTLQKDKEYTVNYTGEACALDPRTVRSYIYKNLEEVNKYMTPPKNVKQKKVCMCFDGLIVDPPKDVDSLKSVGILAFGLIFTAIVYCVSIKPVTGQC